MERIEDHQSNLKTLKYRLELIERENQTSNDEVQKYRQKKMKIEQEKCSLERQVEGLELELILTTTYCILMDSDPRSGGTENLFVE